MRQVANLLKEARVRKGLSQTETGRILRLSEQFISRMEAAKCPIPLKHARRFQKLFGISAVELMDSYLADYKEKLKKSFTQ